MPGEVGSETPTVQLKFVDAGDLYVTWRWQHALTEPRVLAVPRALVRPALDALTAAIPTPRPGERLAAALERAFTGPLADRDREIALSESLARALIPARLAAEVNDFLRRGRRPHLRIQPSPSLGRVPWESLRVDAGERMVHNTDVSLLLPSGVRNAPARRVSDAGDGSVAAVIDPVVPGGAFAPVLPDLTDDSPLGAELLALGDRLRGARAGELSGRRIDRDELRALLATASRLLYVGHVTGGSHGLDVRLHLSCDASTTGRAPLLGPHRPLTAADLAGWRMPARAALLACGSGSDASYAEPAGLVTAMVAGGAEHVTAARWTLPTDAAFDGAGRPFSDAAVAVARAHATADPVRSVAAWQRERADAWEAGAGLAASPLVWAALTTAWAPAPARQITSDSGSSTPCVPQPGAESDVIPHAPTRCCKSAVAALVRGHRRRPGDHLDRPRTRGEAERCGTRPRQHPSSGRPCDRAARRAAAPRPGAVAGGRAVVGHRTPGGGHLLVAPHPARGRPGRRGARPRPGSRGHLRLRAAAAGRG